MDQYNNEGTAENNADLQNDWQNAENNPQEISNDDLRTGTSSGYGLDDEQTYNVNTSAEDKDRGGDDDDDNDDDDDDATMEDWGEVDPSGGDAPTAPGSAV